MPRDMGAVVRSEILTIKHSLTLAKWKSPINGLFRSQKKPSHLVRKWASKNHSLKICDAICHWAAMPLLSFQLNHPYPSAPPPFHRSLLEPQIATKFLVTPKCESLVSFYAITRCAKYLCSRSRRSLEIRSLEGFSLRWLVYLKERFIMEFGKRGRKKA